MFIPTLTPSCPSKPVHVLLTEHPLPIGMRMSLLAGLQLCDSKSCMLPYLLVLSSLENPTVIPAPQSRVLPICVR